MRRFDQPSNFKGLAVASDGSSAVEGEHRNPLGFQIPYGNGTFADLPVSLNEAGLLVKLNSQGSIWPSVDQFEHQPGDY